MYHEGEACYNEGMGDALTLPSPMGAMALSKQQKTDYRSGGPDFVLRLGAPSWRKCTSLLNGRVKEQMKSRLGRFFLGFIFSSLTLMVRHLTGILVKSLKVNFSTIHLKSNMLNDQTTKIDQIDSLTGSQTVCHSHSVGQRWGTKQEQ